MQTHKFFRDRVTMCLADLEIPGKMREKIDEILKMSRKKSRWGKVVLGLHKCFVDYVRPCMTCSKDFTRYLITTNVVCKICINME